MLAGIHFQEPNWLLLCLPLFFFLRRGVFAVLATCLLLFAVAQPYLLKNEITSSVVVLLDTSSSIPKEAQNFFKKEIDKLEDAEIYEFDEVVRRFESAEFIGNGTNLEVALKASQNGKPVILFSDGQENQGRALEVLPSLETPISTVTGEVDWYKEKAVKIEVLKAPVVAGAGEQVEVFSSYSNTTSNKVFRVETWLNDKLVSEESVEISPAHTQEYLTKPLEPGLQKIEVRVFNDNNLVATDYIWINVYSEEQVVLLSGDSESERVLKSALSQLGYDPQTFRPSTVSDVQLEDEKVKLLILNNVSKTQMGTALLDQLPQYLEQGGSLLLVGGKRSFGLGGFRNSVVEKVSPVRFLPPQTKPKRATTAVVLLIDKSRSMAANQKLESAKAAALEAINSTNNRDYIGVIAFDQNPYLLVELRRASEIKGIARGRLRDYLTASGGTNLLPSLAKARRELSKVKAARKHIIVLSDGDVQNPGNSYFREVDKLTSEKISLSTIAIGRRADAPFMKSLAQSGGGTFYHTADPRTLPRIFLKDIKFATGEKSVSEGKDFPVIPRQVDFNLEYPNLLGLVKTEVKDRDFLILESVKDPILASRKYGRGVVSAFTSDLSGRWSKAWLKWRGFGLFIKKLVELHTSSRAQGGELDFDIRYKTEGDNLNLEVFVYNKELPTRILGDIKTPRGENLELLLKQVAPGRYESNIKNIVQGDYFISPKDIPEFALSIREEQTTERTGLGLNLGLLNQLASKSGGRVVKSVDELSELSSENEAQVPLQYYFLALSAVIYFLSVVTLTMQRR